MIKISELQTITVAGVPIRMIETLQEAGYNISQLVRKRIATVYKEIKKKETEQ